MSIGSVNVPGSIGAGIRSNTNILDNPRFQINQRGQENYSGTVYMIDRWRGQRPEIKLEVVSRGIKLSTESVNTARGIMQPLDDDVVKELLGKVVTVSALIEEQSGVDGFFIGLYSALTTTAVTTGQIVASGKSGLITTTWRIPEELPSSHTHLNFYVGFQNTSAVNSGIVRAVKLELGPVQTLAHKDASGNWVLNDPPPNKALELAKCQRYYRKGLLRYRRVSEFPQLFDPTADVIPIQMRIGAIYTFTNIRNSYDDPVDCTIQNVFVDPLGKSFPTIEIAETNIPSVLAVDYEASSDL